MLVAPPVGLEPTTHGLTARCSTNWATAAILEYSELDMYLNLKILIFIFSWKACILLVLHQILGSLSVPCGILLASCRKFCVFLLWRVCSFGSFSLCMLGSLCLFRGQVFSVMAFLFCIFILEYYVAIFNKFSWVKTLSFTISKLNVHKRARSSAW